jgi:hypothetical protein
MAKTLIKIALTLGLGHSSAPAFAGGYVVNGHAASAAEMQFLASYGVQPGSWKVDGYGISPAVQMAAATADANTQSCRYVLDVKLCD